MTILPLIKRELRARARGPALYWTRFGAALVGITVCLLGLAVGGPRALSPTGQGKEVFDGLAGLVFFLNCAMCLLTVDAISRERREGTLGLLFLTRVNGLEVLLGKFGAAGLTGLCALAAVFPVLIIPVLAGGVTGGEAFREGLVLVNVLALSLAAGLWASALGREWLRTAGKALGVLAVLLFGPLILERWIFHGSAMNGVALVSPLALMMRAGDAACKTSEIAYWVGLFAEQVVAWALLWRAGARLRRFALDESQGTTPLPGAAKALEPGRRLFDPTEEPVEHLMRRQPSLKAIIWSAAIFGVAYHLLTTFMPIFRSLRSLSYSLVSMQASALAVTLVQGPLFAWAACRFFVEARRSGELELLLTTPAGSRNIVSSQWKVLKRYLLWPVLLLVTPILLRLVIATWQLGSAPLPAWRMQNGIGYLLAVINTVAGLAAICWLGLWFGYRQRGQAGAIVRTVCLAKGVPYLISQVVTVILVVAGPLRSTRGMTAWSSVVSLTSQLMVLGSYVWMIWFARRRLKRELPGAQGLQFNAWAEARKMIRWLRTWPNPVERADC